MGVGAISGGVGAMIASEQFGSSELWSDVLFGTFLGFGTGALIGVSSAVGELFEVKIGYDAIDNVGIYNTSKSKLKTSSIRKYNMYKNKMELVVKEIKQGTCGYAVATTIQNFASWGLNLLIGW